MAMTSCPAAVRAGQSRRPTNPHTPNKHPHHLTPGVHPRSHTLPTTCPRRVCDLPDRRTLNRSVMVETAGALQRLSPFTPLAIQPDSPSGG